MTAPPTDPVDPFGATTPLPRANVSLGAPTAATPSAPKTIEIKGLSLRTRIFLAIAGTVLLVLAGTLLVGGTSAQKAAQHSLDAALHQTAELIASQLKDDEANRAAKARIFFTNTDFRSTLEKTGGDSASAAVIDSADFLDLTGTVREETGASWVQITDRNGIMLARSDRPGAPVQDVSESPIIAKALNGEIGQGFGVTSDSVLFDAVAVPIYGAGVDKVIGTVMLARNFADSAAERIKVVTGSEIVFFAVGRDSIARVSGGTELFEDRAATAKLLSSLVVADSATPTAFGEKMLALPMDSTGTMSTPKENDIAGTTYVWTVKPFQTTGTGRVVGGVLAVRDKDVALKPFTNMRTTVLGAGAAALGLGLLISFLVAGQITRPVTALVDASRRAAEGDYRSNIPEASGEIGALASAFNLLLEDLREKQSVVDFLQGPGGGATSIAQAARMGMIGSSTRTNPRDMSGMASGQGMGLAPGQILANRYEIKKVLGAGGMGMVYKALDKELGETVAIKTLRPELMEQDSAALDRFRSEIRLARRISHRNVVRTHDIGEVEGFYYITMEFVEGSSLKDLIVSRGRLPAPAVVSIGKQLCRALEVAHEAGVIHRDIKPQNMVVEADGTLKVMDFGIARLQTRTEGLTQAGMVVGTPEYMSPEQLRGDELDGRADLYSAAVVLYESLTGRLPHVADTPGALIGKVLSEVPVPPRQSVAEVSPVLSAAVMQGLEKDREKRPRTALEFLAILDRA